MLALIFTRAARPIAIGSSRAWLTLAGITIRPRATSSRTASRPSPSRSATRSIAGEMVPLRARSICVISAPFAGMSRIRFVGWWS